MPKPSVQVAETSKQAASGNRLPEKYFVLLFAEQRRYHLGLLVGKSRLAEAGGDGKFIAQLPLCGNGPPFFETCRFAPFDFDCCLPCVGSAVMHRE